MTLQTQFLRFTALLALTHTVAAQSGCFWRNGTENPSLDYSPCEASHLSNVCCSIRDVCLDNGLCRSNVGTYWRETCTSSSWNTGECQDLCSYNVRCLLGWAELCGLFFESMKAYTRVIGYTSRYRSSRHAVRWNGQLISLVLWRERLLLWPR
jgi:hypothetical protein